MKIRVNSPPIFDSKHWIISLKSMYTIGVAMVLFSIYTNLINSIQFKYFNSLPLRTMYSSRYWWVRYVTELVECCGRVWSQ
jgi:hypothetical protein